LPGAAKSGILRLRIGDDKEAPHHGAEPATLEETHRAIPMSVIKSVIDWLIKPPAQQKTAPGPVSANAFVPANMAQPAAINIVVCNFDGPQGADVARQLLEVFAEKMGVGAQHLNKRLSISGKGHLVQRLIAAAESGRKWLTGVYGDILIWGESNSPEGSITIRYLCATADADMQPGSFGLGDTLVLPAKFESEFRDIIYAAALAAVGPRKSETRRQEIGDMLQQAAAGLSAFVDAPPSHLEAHQFASVMTCIGNIMASLWRLGGDPSHLDRAIKAYKGVVAKSFNREEPLAWALAQNHLAAALQAKGKLDNNPVPIKLAADSYRALAAALGPHVHANDWALAHIHLGDVLVKLAAYGERVQNLRDAAEAYRTALTIFTRQTMPGPWAELMNTLGVTLMAMGEDISGTKILEQAAVCFRQSLEVRRREVAPLMWAQTANNLGAVTFSLYRRTENGSILNEAAACFEGAAEVYEQFNHPQTAAIARNNLARVRAAESA